MRARRGLKAESFVEPGQISLRSYAKQRILNEMIQAVKNHAHFSPNYIIMLLDFSSVRVFSSCCKWYELYQVGVYHTEILEKKRKKYPCTDAIYFISPTLRSVTKLIDDYTKADATESASTTLDDRPQYGCVHLCFTSKVPDEMMVQIA